MLCEVMATQVSDSNCELDNGAEMGARRFVTSMALWNK
jgi:hypothetical protein